MGWSSPNQRKEAPPGEYVVRHERPYPERMERVFKIGAAVAASICLIAVSWFLLATAHRPVAEPLALAAVAALAAFAAVATYAAVWAIGAVLIGIVIAFRRKRYVVDWQDEPPAPR